MGFTAPSMGLILCLLTASTHAQGTQNNSTNGTDASVCTSGKGRNRISCDEVVLLYRHLNAANPTVQIHCPPFLCLLKTK